MNDIQLTKEQVELLQYIRERESVTDAELHERYSDAVIERSFYPLWDKYITLSRHIPVHAADDAEWSKSNYSYGLSVDGCNALALYEESKADKTKNIVLQVIFKLLEFLKLLFCMMLSPTFVLAFAASYLFNLFSG